MSDKKKMTVCIQCEENGTLKVVHCNQCEIAKRLGGSVGFVGAIPNLDVFIVGLAEKTCPVNRAFVTHKDYFHEVACGTLMFVGSDENGDEVDIDVEAFDELWMSQCKMKSTVPGGK